MPKYLGKDTEFEGLDTFPNPGLDSVTLRSDEVSAVCPVTGQPDWYNVIVTYQPGKWCLETKSLKMYFQQFRNEGIYCEAFARQIAEDLQNALEATYLIVEIKQKSRGGITIEAIASQEEPYKWTQ